MLSPLSTSLGPLNNNRVASIAYRDRILGDNPFAYYRLGESSGTTATDELGNYPGTYTGGYTLGAAGAITGDANTAVTLNGTTGYINLLTYKGSFPTTTMTAECWVKAGSPGASYRLMAALNAKWGYYIKDGILIAYDFAASADRSSGVTVATGAFVHTAYRFNSGVTNGSSLVVNGSQAAQFTATAAGGSVNEMTIGGYPGPVQTLAGTLDEIAIYGALLTDAQLLAHYNAGVGN